ncbi:MAG: hypothetical protein FRX49_07192 [Trebouxia sp. A1-2]|nr:MAG: hypothetical protein FRX49_07192 [Trebouxia sp. A1-2]
MECIQTLLATGAFKGIIDTPCQRPSSSSLDVIQYLPVAKTVSSFKPEGGCALHHDRGLLTLIWSDTVEGLQVVNTKTGLFEDVLVPEGYILVLPGYTLQRATCGIYKAAAHQVTMRDVEGERLAVAFKLRSPDTALLDFHTALIAAGKQVEASRQGAASKHFIPLVSCVVKELLMAADSYRSRLSSMRIPYVPAQHPCPVAGRALLQHRLLFILVTELVTSAPHARAINIQQLAVSLLAEHQIPLETPSGGLTGLPLTRTKDTTVLGMILWT